MWDLGTFQTINGFTLEGETARRRKPPLVWSLLLLSDLTVVCGDSTGAVSFWDANLGTLLSCFGSHQADVLALAATSDERMILASGVDHKVALFTPQPAEPTPPSGAPAATTTISLLGGVHRRRNKWLLTCSRRPHTHDVRALALYEPIDGNAARGAVAQVVSGGIDTQLCFSSLNAFERETPLKLLPQPLPSCCTLAGGAQAAAAAHTRLVLFQESSSLRLWQLPAFTPGGVPPPRVSSDADAPNEAPRQLLLLQPKATQRHLCCSAVSSDGSWICCSDSETRLYAISIGEIGEGTGGAERARVARVHLPSPVLSASCCRFTPDSKAMLLGSYAGIIQV